MNISDALQYLAQCERSELYSPALAAIVLLAEDIVNEGVQFDWDHIQYQGRGSDVLVRGNS
jgi:hypothetical protein